MDPLTITIYSVQDFDGTTPLEGSRDDFEVAQGGRHYRRRIEGPVGVIRTDFWGLFSEGGPKILGLAGSTRNPQNRARLYCDSPLWLVRQDVCLTPQLQHVIVTPGDMLSIRTLDAGPALLTLTVNEITEREHVELARQERWEPPIQRLRLSRTDHQGFTAAGAIWSPPFTWNSSHQLLSATHNGVGPIVPSDILQAQRYHGYYVSVRYSNIPVAGTGRVIIMEPTTGSFREAQVNLQNVEWSKPQFLSHGDMLGLQCSAPAADQNVVADIEVAPVPYAGRLGGRYDRGL